MKTVLAWHFCRADMRTQFTDEPIVVGETLTATGALELCENGMHASERVVDALRYAPGATLCQVELSGEILSGDDKLCARHRKVLAAVDITPQLQEFALLCAERVLPVYEKQHPDDKRVRRCIATTREYLRGATTLDELRGACDGAYSAAHDAYARAACAAAAADTADTAHAASDTAHAASNAAHAASNAAYVTYVANAACAAVCAAAYAAYVANAADAVYAAASRADARKTERDWQEATLISLLPKHLVT